MTTPPTSEPADRPTDGPATVRLDRAPGERFRADRPPPAAGAGPERRPSAGRALGLAALVALGGAVLVAGLGIVDLHAGLLAIGLAVGWATGLAVRAASVTDAGAALGRGARSALSAVVAGLGLVVGFVLVWGWSRSEGGTLGPVDYLAERFGLWAWSVVVLGVVAAALRAR